MRRRARVHTPLCLPCLEGIQPPPSSQAHLWPARPSWQLQLAPWGPPSQGPPLRQVKFRLQSSGTAGNLRRKHRGCTGRQHPGDPAWPPRLPPELCVLNCRIQGPPATDPGTDHGCGSGGGRDGAQGCPPAARPQPQQGVQPPDPGRERLPRLRVLGEPGDWQDSPGNKSTFPNIKRGAGVPPGGGESRL